MSSQELVEDTQVRKLIKDTGMPLLTFAEATGQGTVETLKWWSGKGKSLRARNIDSLSRFLGISSVQILDGTCSKELVRRRIFLGPEVLPEQYQEHASSYVRTSAHIVEYLSLVYGRHFMDKILLNLNIHPLIFDNLDNRINLRFFITLLNELSSQGLSEDEIDSLACYIFLRIQDTDIGSSFARAKNYEESYAVLAHDVTRFETNFEYKFDIDSKGIRIEAKPAEAMLFLSKLETEEYARLFSYRRKAFGWFPILSRLAPLKLNTPQCFLRGDGSTVYQAAFPSDSDSCKLQFGTHLRLL